MLLYIYFLFGSIFSSFVCADKANMTAIKACLKNFNLLNPNGRYSLKGQVSVLGKAIINLHCKAKITLSSDGNNGTTVLEST